MHTHIIEKEAQQTTKNNNNYQILGTVQVEGEVNLHLSMQGINVHVHVCMCACVHVCVCVWYACICTEHSFPGYTRNQKHGGYLLWWLGSLPSKSGRETG